MKINLPNNIIRLNQMVQNHINMPNSMINNNDLFKLRLDNYLDRRMDNHLDYNKNLMINRFRHRI